MNLKNNIYKLFVAFFSFFFILTINANARTEDDNSTTSLSIKCTYGAFVVGYEATTGEVYATTDNTHWKIDTSAITLSSFQNFDGSYSCKDPLYYSSTNSGEYDLSFNEKDSYGIKYSNKSSLKSEEIKVPNEGTTPPAGTYKTCSYGATGAITISYNNIDVKTSVANLDSATTLLAEFNVSDFANGCPEQVYTFSGGGFYRVSIANFTGYTKLSKYDPNTTYKEKCRFENNNGNVVSIYDNSKGDYYVKPSFKCDTINFDETEMQGGCKADIFYETKTESNGSVTCNFSMDPNKEYPNSMTGNSDINGPINCDDFANDGINIISELFNIIMIIGPILALVLGGLDFAKATLASDENALKKAGTNFGKRIAAAILLFLLPLIINLILGIAFDVGVFGNMENVPDVCLTNK
jgi:hypothetical protein